jgi:uncharacterized protein
MAKSKPQNGEIPRKTPKARDSAPIPQRVAALDWNSLQDELNQWGFATTGALLTPAECRELISGYDFQHLFRSRVVMSRHGFGQGEYKYYGYPLPELIADLRESLYPRLAPIANDWQQMLKSAQKYPLSHQEYLERCHRAGQPLPTPLLLKYGEGDYNCMHRDIYGDLLFPMQVAFLLSDTGTDFEGGEFVLTEQRPRMQSRVAVVPLQMGEGVIFTVNQRPVIGNRGVYRVAMRHGVSRIRSGRRFTLGIIFHDAA